MIIAEPDNECRTRHGPVRGTYVGRLLAQVPTMAVLNREAQTSQICVIGDWYLIYKYPNGRRIKLLSILTPALIIFRRQFQLTRNIKMVDRGRVSASAKPGPDCRETLAQREWISYLLSTDPISEGSFGEERPGYPV